MSIPRARFLPRNPPVILPRKSSRQRRESPPLIPHSPFRIRNSEDRLALLALSFIALILAGLIINSCGK